MSVFTIISPAKRLGKIERTKQMPSEDTIPGFEKEARRLAEFLSPMSSSALMKLMDISKDLADLNLERYQTFPDSLKKSSAPPAILQFQGEVFQALRLSEYGTREHKYLKDHVGILSGMYGLLRPYDKMHPYRLEMGTRLKIDSARNLYEFWGHRITDAINKKLQKHGIRTLLSLASDEYARSVDFSSIQATVASVDFLEFKAGKWKVVSMNAKRARGKMLDWMIRKRPGSLSALKKYDEGYEFSEEVADGAGIHRLIFRRKPESET